MGSSAPQARPAGALPQRRAGARHMDCPHYEWCLDAAIKSNWSTFSCGACPHQVRTAHTESPDEDKRRDDPAPDVARPKRAGRPPARAGRRILEPVRPAVQAGQDSGDTDHVAALPPLPEPGGDHQPGAHGGRGRRDRGAGDAKLPGLAPGGAGADLLADPAGASLTAVGIDSLCYEPTEAGREALEAETGRYELTPRGQQALERHNLIAATRRLYEERRRRAEQAPSNARLARDEMDMLVILARLTGTRGRESDDGNQ